MKPTQTFNRLTFSHFFKIFLIVAFPVHVWSLLMIFKDAEFVTERTVAWDTVGYAGYSLIFALLESLALAILFWALSLLLPKTWTEKRNLSLVGSLVMILSLASMLEQAAHAWNEPRLSRMFLHGLEKYPNQTYALIAGAILVAVVISIMAILRSEKFTNALAELFDRLSMLSYLYLFLDFAGIVIVLIRNFSENL